MAAKKTTKDQIKAKETAETAVTVKVPERQKAKRAAAKPEKLSALDAALKVLVETGQPMNCQEMIAAMAAKGYWSSPGGKTPAATLYSAILRELTTKGNEARFKKTERGKFASNG
jgi:HB1, ASXL, restriction endonuclease HTH domain